MKQFVIKHKFSITAFFYLTLSFILMMTHEPWRDEAQQWLICRDLDIVGIIKQLKYEGHFLLWYLILLPFVKLGLPYITQNILSWAISGIGGLLFLKKVPFKYWKKLLVIFSPAYLYYFPAISRCYCLIPLAIFFIIMTYPNRFKIPLPYLLSIVFLVNIHIFFLAVAGLLLLDYYYELYKNLKMQNKSEKTDSDLIIKTHIRNLIIVFLLLLLSGLPLIDSWFQNKSIMRGMNFGELLLEITLSLPLASTRWILSFVNIPIEVYIALMFLLEIIIISIYSYNKKLCLFSIIYSLYYFILAGCSIGLSAQKICVLYIALLLFFVLFKNDDKPLPSKMLGFFYVLLFINIVTSINFYKYDFLYKYTQAKDVAEYFNEFEEDIVLLTGNQREMINSVIPYLNDNVKVYDIQFGDYTTYTIWDNHILNPVTEKDITNAINSIGNNKSYYYVYFPEKNRPLSDSNTIANMWLNDKLELIEKFDSSFGMNEKYWIFKIIR